MSCDILVTLSTSNRPQLHCWRGRRSGHNFDLLHRPSADRKPSTQPCW